MLPTKGLASMRTSPKHPSALQGCHPMASSLLKSTDDSQVVSAEESTGDLGVSADRMKQSGVISSAFDPTLMVDDVLVNGGDILAGAPLIVHDREGGKAQRVVNAQGGIDAEGDVVIPANKIHNVGLGETKISMDDQFSESISAFIIHVTKMSRLSIDQINCRRFSQAVHECEDYLTILEPKVTSLNGAQQWVRQYRELLDLMGCLRRKVKSFGGFPMVSTSCPFDIQYSSDFPFFVVLKKCQDQIKSNVFSVSEAKDLYMRYTDYRARIAQGREVFGCLDSSKELLGLTLLIETLELYVRLSKKELSLLNSDVLGRKYIAMKETVEKNLGKQSEYIVAVDFLISMLTSYQLSMVSHYQAKIENRSLPLNVAQELVKWCDSQHQKKLPRQWCPASVLDSHIRNIAQLSSSLKNYLYCCQLLMCIKKNQLKINERDLSLADAQRLDTWCGIKLKKLMSPQGIIKCVSDSLIVALNNLLLNVRCYVKPLDYEQLLLFIREDQAKIDMRALPLDEAKELKKWYWFEYEKRMVSLGSSVPLSNPGIRLIYSFMEKLTFYMNCIK